MRVTPIRAWIGLMLAMEVLALAFWWLTSR